MSLKIVIATLIIVGLSSESTAAEITIRGQRPTTEIRIQDYSNMIPGFSYVKGFFQPFMMFSPSGFLQGYQKMRNTTAWQPSFRNGSSSISQMMQFPDMSVVYNQTKTQMGFFKSLGSLLVNAGNNTFQLSMNATPSENGTCMIQLQMVLTDLGVNIDTSSLGLVGALLQALLAVLSGLLSTLVGVLSGILPQVLTLLVGQDIAGKVDLDEICKMLLESNMTNFPEPQLSNIV